MATKRKPKPGQKITGYGYCGTWNDGTLGWWMPSFIFHRDQPNDSYLSRPDKPNTLHDGDMLIKVKVTVEPVRGRNGKPVRRSAKALGVSCYPGERK